eukprot:m51a1_g5355 putative af436836_1 at5g35180 t25c13_60 (491) ;mRNA; r:476809-478741
MVSAQAVVAALIAASVALGVAGRVVLAYALLLAAGALHLLSAPRAAAAAAAAAARVPALSHAPLAHSPVTQQSACTGAAVPRVVLVTPGGEHRHHHHHHRLAHADDADPADFALSGDDDVVSRHRGHRDHSEHKHSDHNSASASASSATLEVPPRGGGERSWRRSASMSPGGQRLCSAPSSLSLSLAPPPARSTPIGTHRTSSSSALSCGYACSASASERRWSSSGGSASSDEQQQRRRSRRAPPRRELPALPEPYRGSMRARAFDGDSDCIGDADATGMAVRGPSYLADRVKVPSRPALCRLAAADLLVAGERQHNVCARLEAELRRIPGRLLVTNFILPGPPYMHFVMYFAVPEDETSENAVGLRLLRRFMDPATSDDERSARLKLIPRVVSGPWLARRAVGSGAAIIGRKIATSYHFGERYCEVDADVASSYAATAVFGAVKGSLRSLVLELAFVVEGQREDELPEHILGAVRVDHLDLDGHARSLD